MLMKIKKIKAYMCPYCDDLYDNDCEAEDCCKQSIEQIDAYQCGECDSVFEDKDEAKSCCK
jgi:hypothetical protein